MRNKATVEAAARLRILIKDEGNVSVKALAGACGVTERTVNNWMNRGLPFKHVNLVSKALNINVNYFLDRAALVAERGTGPYKLIGASMPQEGDSVTFSGMTTGALTRFVADNGSALQECHITLHTLGYAPRTFKASDLKVVNDNYVRRLVLFNQVTIGGANAVLEDQRLDRVSFHFQTPRQRLDCSEASGFPVLMDRYLLETGPSALDVLDRTGGRDDAILHYCIRMPSARTFGLIMRLLPASKFDFNLKALDAVKAFASYVRGSPTDGDLLRNYLVGFVEKNLTSPDHSGAISLAIEALSMVTDPQRSDKGKVLKILDNILQGRGKFDRLTDENRLAAKVARAFIPHAMNPIGFTSPR